MAVVAVAALLSSACGDGVTSERPVQATNDGVQMSGRIGGANLSVSFGDPDFLITDCEVDDVIDGDWCLVARSIDGAQVTLVIENPAIFVPGEKLSVGFDRCTGCDDVQDHAVVDLEVGGVRRRAVGGTIEVIEASPRYAMAFNLRFDDGGTISGECNVRPLGAIVPVEEQTPFGTE